jgi:hypothetical protein
MINEKCIWLICVGKDTHIAFTDEKCDESINSCYVFVVEFLHLRRANIKNCDFFMEIFSRCYRIIRNRPELRTKISWLGAENIHKLTDYWFQNLLWAIEQKALFFCHKNYYIWQRLTTTNFRNFSRPMYETLE